MAHFIDRTTKALGRDVMAKLQALEFCVVGCGGTGANFAEMLVRSGATQLTLIDGDVVDPSNLNRVFSFAGPDINHPKVDALKARLDSIRPDLNVRPFATTFKEPQDILDDSLGQPARDAVYDADVVFVGTDTNASRLAIEALHASRRGAMLISCGILVDRKAGIFEFECNWSPKTPPERAADEGYGPEQASFPSIVLEATAVAFSMLISHLNDCESPFRSYLRRYDASFLPVETLINGKSSCSTPS